MSKKEEKKRLFDVIAYQWLEGLGRTYGDYETDYIYGKLEEMYQAGVESVRDYPDKNEYRYEVNGVWSRIDIPPMDIKRVFDLGRNHGFRMGWFEKLEKRSRGWFLKTKVRMSGWTRKAKMVAGACRDAIVMCLLLTGAFLWGIVAGVKFGRSHRVGELRNERLAEADSLVMEADSLRNRQKEVLRDILRSDSVTFIERTWTVVRDSDSDVADDMYFVGRMHNVKL